MNLKEKEKENQKRKIGGLEFATAREKFEREEKSKKNRKRKK